MRYLPCGRYDKYDENVGADRRVCPTNTSNAIPGEHTGSPLQANTRSILQVWRSQKICKSRRANTKVRKTRQWLFIAKVMFNGRHCQNYSWRPLPFRGKARNVWSAAALFFLFIMLNRTSPGAPEWQRTAFNGTIAGEQCLRRRENSCKWMQRQIYLHFAECRRIWIKSALAPQRSVLQHHSQPRDVACDSRICYANRQYRQQLVVRSADEVCTARDAKRRYCQFQKAVMTNFVLCRVLCYFLSHRK